MSKSNTYSPFYFRIFASGLSLWLFLIVVRAQILGFGIFGLLSPKVIAHSVLTSRNDFFFVFSIVFVFFALGWLVKNRIFRLSLIVAFLIAAVFILLSQVAYSVFIGLTGSAITYQWLFYSDFLSSPDAKNAVAANLSASLFGMLVGLLTLMFGAAWSVYQGIRRLKYSKNIIFGFAVFSVLFSVATRVYSQYKSWAPPYLANPIATFVSTSPLFQSAPNLFTLAINDEDMEAVASQHQTKGELSPLGAPIRNVVLLVLESVPSEYIQSYGSEYPCTPNLDRFSDISFQVNNAYAHTPSTNKSVFSLLTSLYPWVSFSSITSEYPDVATSSLSSVLTDHNYQSAFITSADNRFQNIGEFVNNRSFGLIKDQQNSDCDIKSFPASSGDWLYMDGIADECIANEFENWLGSISVDEDPFFAMLWTVQTHYPYFTVESEKNEEFSADDRDLNRYLNALKESDRVFGDVMAQLKSRNLDSTTLVVVVGDHGEAFGRHQQRGHATKLYEENVRIPMLFFNPVLFKGEKSNRLAGLIDVAPTIVHALGIPSPDVWQGKSVFSDAGNEATYFFAPFSTFIFGYRESNFKYLYDAGYNSFEMYDLSKDPLETTNLAKNNPDIEEKIQKKLAAWVQYHESYMETYVFP